MITDGHGTPFAVLLTGGNPNDVTQLLPLLDAIPPVRGRVDHPRRKLDSLFADRGYDRDIYRDQVRARDRPPWHSARHRTGHPPLSSGEEFCLVARLPTPANPLGTASRHPRSVPRTRLLPHHPSASQGIALTLEPPGIPWMPVAHAMIRPHQVRSTDHDDQAAARTLAQVTPAPADLVTFYASIGDVTWEDVGNGYSLDPAGDFLLRLQEYGVVDVGTDKKAVAWSSARTAVA